jgi:cysteine desulfurase
MSTRHYLDANASEPLRPEAMEAMAAAASLVGNPASVHAEGRAARRLLEDARERLASHFGARPEAVVFTSGATEANALAMHALAGQSAAIVFAAEHDSVRANPAARRVLPVDRDGVADLAALEAALIERPALVCLMLANNETGVLQPVAEAAALCRRYGAPLHVDAVQAAGRIPVDLAALAATTLALSAHKLGGPQGAGALLIAPDQPNPCPLLAGGGQERGWRGGTPPLPAIAGFAAAVRAAPPAAPLGELRDAAERAAIEAGAIVAGDAAARLANTTSLALPGIRADAQVIALDLDGIAVSAGAACSSGKVARSHVLEAMGFGELAGQAIRVSLPWNVAASDIEAFAQAYGRMAVRLRAALAPRAA